MMVDLRSEGLGDGWRNSAGGLGGLDHSDGVHGAVRRDLMFWR